MVWTDAATNALSGCTIESWCNVHNLVITNNQNTVNAYLFIIEIVNTNSLCSQRIYRIIIISVQHIVFLI